MKIKVEPYNPNWILQFEKIKTELHSLLKELNPKIEHFGSTAVPGLAAKPVVDVLVGLKNLNTLDYVVKSILQNPKYLYYKTFDEDYPERRLFVRIRDEIDEPKFEKVFLDWDSIPHEEINRCRIAHVHVWKENSKDWIRHIAFRDYLKKHPVVKKKYETLKLDLSYQNWEDGMGYNQGKNKFIETEEAKAISWYSTLSKK